MQFSLLGPLRVTGDDGPLDLGGPRQRTVLAVLLLRFGRRVQAEELIDDVWGEEPPAAAMTSLYSYVSRLRKLLGRDRIDGRAGGYALLADPDEVDADVFTRTVRRARATVATDPRAAVTAFERAEQLWRGPALADLRDQLGLRPAAAGLDELRRSAVEERLGAELALARHAAVVPELEMLVERFPERELLSRHLMLALYRCGRQGEALAAYRSLRERLAERLGLDPSPQVERLQRRILAHDPSLDVVGQPLRGYRLLEQVGRGSTGAVHRAVQPHVDRPVAVTSITAELADDPAFVRRFEARARRIARLDHPHVAPTHDYWREPGAAYVVTPFFEGGSLEEALVGGRLTAAWATAVAAQVAGALAFAHAHGVLHGNVHAGNVLLDSGGNAYLGDFATGLGLDVAVGGRSPGRGGLAPEVVDGGATTVLADVFSLGRLLSSLGAATTDARLLAVGRRAAAADPTQRYGDVDELLEELVGNGPDRAPAPATAARNPYKGLRAFDRADEDDFFGRDALVTSVVERITAGERFLLVVGPSGSGKSSLVRAGVLPALSRGAVPGSDDWFVLDVVPGDRPFAELGEAIRSVASAPAWTTLSLAEHDLVTHLREALPDAATRVLVVVDQFEELFTLAAPDVRDAFLDAVAAAVADPGGRVLVIATLRADHYDGPLEHPAVADLAIAGTLGVPPLTPEELGAAIAGPAARVGIDVDHAVVARLTTDIAAAAGALPMLQYALTEMFDLLGGGTLGMDEHDGVGGIQGAISHRAESVWRHLAPADREVAPGLFLQLVAHHGDGVRRRRVARDELDAVVGGGAVDQLLDDFGAARLLSFDRDPATRGPTVEIAHESLLEGWGRLAGWIDEARYDLVQQRRLARAAEEWGDADRDASYLLRGARLRQVLAWRRTTSLAATPAEEAFVAASSASRDRVRADRASREQHERDLERRARSRLRAVVAVLVSSLVIGGVVATFALVQRADASRQARVASARELAAASMASLGEDSQRSVLLAVEAVELTRSRGEGVVPEAQEALHHAIGASRVTAVLDGVGGHLALGADGTTLVTEGPEQSGLVEVRDLATGAVVSSFVGHRGTVVGSGDINAVALDPGGARLATGGDDGTLRVWALPADPAEPADQRVEQPEPDLEVGDRPGGVWGPAFSPSGATVAAAWFDEGVVRAVDVATGLVEYEVRLPGPSGVAFSPDGTRLAIIDDSVGVVLVAADDGAELVRFGRGSRNAPNAVSYSPDGRHLATADGDAVQVRDASTGELLGTAAGAATVLDVAWHPDGVQLAAGDAVGRAYVWEVGQDGAPLRLRHRFEDPTSGVAGVAFTPDGDGLVAGEVGVREGATTWRWDLRPAGGAELLALEGATAERAQFGAAFVGEGDVAVVSGVDDELVTYQRPTAASADPVPTGRTDVGSVRSLVDVDVSTDGRRIAWRARQQTVGWDLTEGREVFRVRDGRSRDSVAWSPDGRHAAIGGAGSVRVVDAATGSGWEWTIDDADGISDLGFAAHVDFSPDGRLLAVGGSSDDEDGRVRVELWDWRARELVRVLRTEQSSGQVQLAFAPDGDLLAVAGGARVELLDVATGERVGELPTGGEEAWLLAASPDGRLLATAGRSGVVDVWDAMSGRRRVRLPEHANEVWTIGFSQDGSRLVSTDLDGDVRVWALDVPELLEVAERELVRGLTDAECRRFLGDGRCAAP